MAIKINWQDLQKRFINWQEILRVYKNWGQIRPETVPPTADYLCFTANTAGSTIKLNGSSSLTQRYFEYSWDWTTWTDYALNSRREWEVITFTNVWDKLYFRNKSETVIPRFSNLTYQRRFTMTWSIAASWDINYMLCKYSTDSFPYNDWSNNTPYYCGLFKSCKALTSAPKLPITTVVPRCYSDMFYWCTWLLTAPELPATTLASHCYSNMFYYCTSLTTAPALPATTLAPYCYSSMFNYCTSLTTAPTLSSTSLAGYCYQGMFAHCASLRTSPALPATTLAPYCYQSMFRESGLVNPPALPATTIAEACYSLMFMNTNINKFVALPATQLEQNCYTAMYSYCSNLRMSDTQWWDFQNEYRIPVSWTWIDATNSTYNMFNNIWQTPTATPSINTTYYTSNTVI